jgi:hypothetical protein
MSYYLNYFKELDFKPNHGYYLLETNGGDATSWTSKYCLEISKVFEKIGHGDLCYKVIPSFTNIELLEEEDIEQIKNSILSPEECLKIFNENNLLNKIKEKVPELYSSFEFLYEKWSEGYKVILTD